VRTTHLRYLQPLVVRALAMGAKRVNPYRVVWVTSGNCTDPFVEERHGAVYTRGSDGIVGFRCSQMLEIHRRCRKCDNCRKQRQVLWRERAKEEVNQTILRGCRTWFGTLTLNPAVEARMRLACISREADQGVVFEQLPEPEQFRLRWLQVSAEITLALKRARTSGQRFRHLIVSEKHDGDGLYGALGVPHAHLLIHELDVGAPIRHAQLAELWPHGFSTWKLVEEPRHVSYVTKYLAKDARSRVRASQRYGESSTVLTQSRAKARL